MIADKYPLIANDPLETPARVSADSLGSASIHAIALEFRAVTKRYEGSRSVHDAQRHNGSCRRWG